MREAGRIAAEILQQAALAVAPGISTGEVDAIAADLMKARGCRSAFLGYRKFPGHICISLNEEVVHGIGDRRRQIAEGDLVKIDVGIITPDGWVGDNAMTVPTGEVSEEAEQLMRATEDCLDVAIRHAYAGHRLADLCAAVESCAQSFGYTVVREMVGHGVGRDLHEEPQVPNYWDRLTMGSGPKLAPGMILAIEPMINQGVPDIRILSDKWTVVTDDGKLSAHYEHTVLITEDEPEILTPRKRVFPVKVTEPMEANS